MSTLSHTASAQAITARMDSQRALLHRQFVQRPRDIAASNAAAMSQPGTAVMQPATPRSLLMRLLVANPQLIRRAGVLAVTTLVGARYSSWGLRLLGLFLAARKR
ncbi:MAG: hypothetical protein Q7J29_12060 [Stagnimonas sp.]|nr:hypothetical protein [Stagnimonas sp.]